MNNAEYESTFLRALFEGLNEQRIEFCILRNYEGLPESNLSKDVDILIDRSSMQKVKSVLSMVTKETGTPYCFHTTFQPIECFNFYRDGTNSVKVDFFFNFEARGARFMSGSDILRQKKAYKGFYVAGEVHDAVISWLKPLITGGVFKTAYREKIISSARKDPVAFKECVSRIIGDALTDKVLPMITAGSPEETLAFSGRIRQSAWLRSFTREPFFVIRNLLLHILIEIKRQLLFPRKKMIVVIGPDGTGKSTVIDSLAAYIPELCKEVKDNVRVIHFRPNLIPNLKVLLSFGTKQESMEEYHRPHRAEPSGLPGSLARLLYYFFDYTAGFVLRVRPLFSKNYLVIFDRYYYDFIVDPARSRVKLPNFIPLLLMRLVPKPTLVVFLDNDVETILRRKQELTPAELSRQLEEYRALARKFPWFYVVDSRKPVDEIVYDIASAYVCRVSEPVEKALA